jgi:hypothetical protein
MQSFSSKAQANTNDTHDTRPLHCPSHETVYSHNCGSRKHSQLYCTSFLPYGYATARLCYCTAILQHGYTAPHYYQTAMLLRCYAAAMLCYQTAMLPRGYLTARLYCRELRSQKPKSAILCYNTSYEGTKLLAANGKCLHMIRV